MLYRSSFRLFSCLTLAVFLLATASVANAQFDKLKRKIPGLGSSSEVDSILSQMEGARVKSAYARITLSLADDIIRRQALRNTTKKSARGQIELDEKQIKELDQSIAEKRKLLANLGRKSGGGKYDDETSASVEKQLQEDEKKRAESRAQVDEQIADYERNEKQLSKKDRDNYAQLAKVLYGASKQEREALETAKDTGPRAQSAATNTGRNPLSLANTKPKKLDEGLKAMNAILAEGPQHLSTLTTVAGHLARIGGLNLTEAQFQGKVVTDEDQIPTDW
ncbi:MAG TPA: hypothetical protein VFD58_29985 [Blastocatellia bacterium]|nr:hypothetical protein [Blastocatellia bacterium]